MRSHLDATDPTSVDDATGAALLRIFILSDVRLYREGLAGSLLQRGDIDVLGAMCPSDSALGHISRSAATALLLDLGAPGALRFAMELDRLTPCIKVVAFAVSEVDNELIACAEAGIVGYVARDGSIEDLVNALRSAVRGEATCSPHHAALLVKRVAALRDRRSVTQKPAGQTSALTSREREIAVLVREGMSNKEIARSLRIGSATVKNHVHSILTKLQAKSRGHAAATLHRAHLEHPERLR
jgi:two-component system nitrate/nitrite response regulator NarL